MWEKIPDLFVSTDPFVSIPGEEILAGLFCKLACDFPFVIYEIPVEQRDPSCPTRLRVTLRQDIPSPE